MNGRVWGLIEKTDGCWLWMGYVAPDGYGRVWVGGRQDGRRHQAHRYVYESLVGVRRCVNPAHLEPVTARENVRRGVGPGAHWGDRTHCSNGHEFIPENTRLRPDGARRCRVCERENGRRRWQRERESEGA